MPTDARERVARAICRRTLLETKQDADEATVGSYWKHYLPEADDALSALGWREMVEALEKAQWYVNNFPSASIPGDKPFVDDIELVDAALSRARGEKT